MTEEQFDALYRWVHLVAREAAMREQGGRGMLLSNAEMQSAAAERVAREAFLGKTYPVQK